tara:strand:- start:415 stop:2343 length:1929 start_codon:yes stop_codon:yes gene_type:complete
MCGISGIFSLSGKTIDNIENRINLMSKLLNHRGPDQSGVYISEKKNFALANNRLSIVSPNEKINLPFSKNKNDFLSFNGEIYNYLDIRKTLEHKQVKFETKTDTEVIYEFIKNFKLENLKKINGMWAFAFYNKNKHELILSRDLLGERHLFYTINDDEIVFSSEVYPIIQASQENFDLDFDSMMASWKFNTSLPGKTLMKNINRLKPGTNLKVLNNKIEIEQFQKLHPEKWFDFFNSNPSYEMVSKRFEEILATEIDLRLPKDVDYYSTLSGGIDSSILAYFIKKILNKKVYPVFGISADSQKNTSHWPGIGEEGELSSSKHLASELGLDLRITDFKNINLSKEMEKIARNGFDGCIDAGVASFGSLGEFVKKNKAKCMIVSEGPDELLGGYDSDIEANVIDQTIGPGKPLNFLHNLTSTNLGKTFLTNFLRLKKNKEFEFKYKPFLTRVNHSVCPNQFFNKITDNYDLKKFYEYGSLDPMYSDLIPHMDFSQLRALNYAAKTLPDMYNLRLDKSFMRHSVEVRLPFQSVNLVEFFLAMPNKYRFKGRKGKYFLRRYVEKNIDKKTARRKKYGLGPYLWSDPLVYNSLKIEDTIMSTDFFEKYPFSKTIKKTLLDKNTHSGNKWSAYALIKTYENNKKADQH